MTNPFWPLSVSASTVEAARRSGQPQSVMPTGAAAFAQAMPGGLPKRDWTPPTAYVTGGQVQTEPNPRLDQESWFGSYGDLGALDKMMREWSILQAGQLAWTLTTLSRPWMIDPAKGGDKNALTHAEFLRVAIDSHYSGGGGGMMGLLSQFAPLPIRGFVLGQPYYPVDPSLTVRDEDGKVVLQGAHVLQIAPIPSQNVTDWIPHTARDGSQRWGVKVYDVGSDEPGVRTEDVELDPDQLVHARFLPNGDDPAPYGLLRPAWILWQQWRTLSKLQVNGWQKAAFGVPEIVIGPDANPAELAGVNSIVSNLRVGSSVRFSLPIGYSLKWHEVPFRAGDIDATKQQLKLDALAGMFAQHVATGSANGTQALHGSQKAEFHQLAEVVARQIVQTLSSGPVATAPLKRLLSLNFDGIDQYPTLAFGPMPVADPSELVKAITDASAGGALTLDGGIEDRVRAALSLAEMPQETREQWRARLENEAPPEVNSPDDDDEPTPPSGGGSEPTVDEGGEGADDAEDESEVAPVAASELGPERTRADRMLSGPRGRAVRPLEEAVRLSETRGATSAGKDELARVLTRWREDIAQEYAEAIDAEAVDLGDVASIPVPGQAELVESIRPALRRVYRAGGLSVVAELERIEADPDLARRIADGTAEVGVDIAPPARMCDHGSLLELMVSAPGAYAAPKGKGKRRVKAPAPSPDAQQSLFDDIEPEEAIDAIARTTAATMAGRLRASAAATVQAQGVGGMLPSGLVGLVTQGILDLSPGVERNQAQGDVNTTFGLARAQQQQAEGVERFMFSNLMESDTCAQCEAVDGAVFGASELPTYSTPYRDCEGGDRCNCLVLALPPGQLNGQNVNPLPPTAP